MRIAILADRLVMGGLETHLITLIKELLRRGHQIALNAAYVNPLLLTLIQSAPGSFHYVAWSGDPVKDLNWFFPEVIHAHPFTAIFRGFEVARELGKPFFVTMHGLYDFGLDRSTLGNQVSELVGAIIAVDYGVAELLQKCTAHPEKIKVIFNGIDLTEFYPRPLRIQERSDLGLTPYWKTVVMVSRLADGKEQTVYQVLRCASQLGKAVKGINIVVVGDGPGLAQIRDQVEPLRRLGDVRLLAVGPRQDVADFLALADLVLACDRAALEAMACERAVLAMNASGFAGPLTYNNYQEALFYRRGYERWNNNELTRAILTLLKNDSYRNSLARDGLQFVLRHFDLKRAIDRLEDLYQAGLKG